MRAVRNILLVVVAILSVYSSALPTSVATQGPGGFSCTCGNGGCGATWVACWESCPVQAAVPTCATICSQSNCGNVTSSAGGRSCSGMGGCPPSFTTHVSQFCNCCLPNGYSQRSCTFGAECCSGFCNADRCQAPPPPTCEPSPGSCLREDQQWNYITCECDTVCPVVFDGDGDGLALTSASNGVSFDLTADGIMEHLSWTSAGSDDAFIALDRNSNGRIDDGSELFGFYTEQPDGPDKNGFRALAVFDAIEMGGNRDGQLNAADTVFSSLLLWTDENHDGVSQPVELTWLAQSGITAIDLDYRSSRRRDQYGNLLRWRSKAEGVHGRSKWLWDVVFQLYQ